MPCCSGLLLQQQADMYSWLRKRCQLSWSTAFANQPDKMQHNALAKGLSLGEMPCLGPGALQRGTAGACAPNHHHTCRNIVRWPDCRGLCTCWYCKC